MKKLIGATLLIVSFICGGCENEMATPENKFILNPKFERNDAIENYIILLTDDEGNIIFYEKEKEFTKTISISIDPQKQLHLTHGIITNLGSVSIQTFKNIESGFKFSNIYAPNCDKPRVRQVNLIINNIEPPTNLFVGLGFPQYSYSTQKKELKIKGRIKEETEFLVTVLTSQDSIYKSYRVPHSKWSMDNSTLEIDFTEFHSATTKEIKLDKEGVWRTRSKIIWDEGSNFINYMDTAEPLWNASIDSQKGSKINVFIESDLPNPEYHSEFWGQGHYEKIVGTMLPEKITLYDPFIEIVDSSPENFQANLSEDIELVSIQFWYRGAPVWSVYQLNEIGKAFKMIELPQEFLQKELQIKEVINKSDQTSLAAFQTNMKDIVSKFQQGELFRVLECNSYSKKTVSK